MKLHSNINNITNSIKTKMVDFSHIRHWLVSGTRMITEVQRVQLRSRKKNTRQTGRTKKINGF